MPIDDNCEICKRVNQPPCYWCRSDLTQEESMAKVQAGIAVTLEGKVKQYTKEQIFEMERQRLNKRKGRRKK